MSAYHINPATGEPGQCRAMKSCPFGDADDHFVSAEKARAAYEEMQAGNTFQTMKKSSSLGSVLAKLENRGWSIPTLKKVGQGAIVAAALSMALSALSKGGPIGKCR